MVDPPRRGYVVAPAVLGQIPLKCRERVEISGDIALFDSDPESVVEICHRLPGRKCNARTLLLSICISRRVDLEEEVELGRIRSRAAEYDDDHRSHISLCETIVFDLCYELDRTYGLAVYGDRSPGCRIDVLRITEGYTLSVSDIGQAPTHIGTAISTRNRTLLHTVRRRMVGTGSHIDDCRGLVQFQIAVGCKRIGIARHTKRYHGSSHQQGDRYCKDCLSVHDYRPANPPSWRYLLVIIFANSI